MSREAAAQLHAAARQTTRVEAHSCAEATFPPGHVPYGNLVITLSQNGSGPQSTCPQVPARLSRPRRRGRAGPRWVNLVA